MVAIEMRVGDETVGTALSDNLAKLEAEHQSQVMYATETKTVSKLSDNLFRSYNIENAGHAL